MRAIPRRDGILGALFACVVAPAAFAQDGAETVEEIIVTGSRIPQPNLVGPSPVTPIDAKELALTGTTRVEDLVKQIPQVSATQSAGQSNGATGTATVQLRYLGDQRTLVLLDGRRLPQGSPQTAGAADVNQIPGALVERIDVLTGGSSAIYGSDAVAGVVNFVMRDDFDGLSFEYQRSAYRHDNDSDSMASVLDAAGFEHPSGTVDDGDADYLNLVWGRNFADDRGNLTLYAGRREIDAVLQADRDYSACALNGAPAGFFCGGSPATPEGRFVLFDATGTRPRGRYEVQGDRFVPPAGFYNFGPYNYFQRPDERDTAGAFGVYRFGNGQEAYAQAMYMEDESVAQLAPTGAFGLESGLNCANPLLSAQQLEILCTSIGLAAGDTAPGLILRRNAEGGPRRAELRHEAWRFLAGLRGDLPGDWHYDAYAQRGEVDYDQAWSNEMLVSRMERALDIVADPGTGEAVCRAVLDGSDPDCVPWNIYTTGAVTPASLAYLQVPVTARGSTEQTVLSAYVRGTLDALGVRSPLADSAVEMVFGLEYREEDLEYLPDRNLAAGDAASASSGPGIGGGYDVSEAFAELRVPIVEQRRFVDAAEAELGYRYSDYSIGVDTHTFKLGFAWHVDAALMFRASLQRAVRVANIAELYEPVLESGFVIAGGDPCAGPEPARTLGDCARTGVRAEQYGSIAQNPLDESVLNSFAGGNPELDEETAKTWSIGVVLTPGFAPELNLSIDWYSITVDEAIGTVAGDTYLLHCLDTGAEDACARIHRDPSGGARSGALWTDDGFVDMTRQNIGYFDTQGVDLVVDFVVDLPREWGRLRLDDTFGYVASWSFEDLPGTASLDCASGWNGRCGAPIPEWRNYMRLTWEAPREVTLSLLWRHFDRVEDLADTGQDLDAYDYLDATAQWRPTERLALRAGVNNLLDRRPPLFGAEVNSAGLSGGGANGNTLPGTYDALGQYWFAGVKFDL